MKVAIVSDTHFGFKWDSEREDDCFENAREAFRRTRDADLVILPGDIYDHKIPKQEVLGRSIDCFNEYRDGDCVLTFAEESDVKYDFMGTPLVAIHGTHERRSKGFTNPIELLDKMGYLLHLHNEKAVFKHEETGEKVAVHGMSGVPERYAPGVLEEYAPEPVENAYNIFVFHQSVENFVYTSQDHAHLKLEHLPDGFDLLVDGHIHWYDLSNQDSDKPLILPGSTVSTQMRKVEAEKPKGFVTVDTEADECTFHELDTPRKLSYKEMDVDGMSTTEILDAIHDELEDISEGGFDKKPLVRLVLTGTTDATVTQTEIREQYDDHCILSISKRFDTASTDISAQTFEENTKSVKEMGMELLRSKLETDTLRVEQLFELLADEQLDAALKHVEELELPDEDTADVDATQDVPDGQDSDDADTGVVDGAETAAGPEQEASADDVPADAAGDTDEPVAAADAEEAREDVEESAETVTAEQDEEATDSKTLADFS